MPLILVAEDHEPHRVLFERAAKGLNYNLIFAVDGNDAIEKINELNPDIIFLDLNMPHKTGLEVLEAIDAVHRVVIVLTTSRQEWEKNLAYEKGAKTFITKPMTQVKMKEAVRKVDGYWFDEQVSRPGGAR